LKKTSKYLKKSFENRPKKNIFFDDFQNFQNIFKKSSNFLKKSFENRQNKNIGVFFFLRFSKFSKYFEKNFKILEKIF